VVVARLQLCRRRPRGSLEIASAGAVQPGEQQKKRRTTARATKQALQKPRDMVRMHGDFVCGPIEGARVRTRGSGMRERDFGLLVPRPRVVGPIYPRPKLFIYVVLYPVFARFDTE
jgi:hypothetical protein